MGPSWEVIAVIAGSVIMFLMGIVVSLVTGYAKGLGTRIGILETAHQKLNDTVLSRYHDKDETNRLLGDVKERMESLHSRFDLLLLNQVPQPKIREQ